jgi:NADH dehydrogenase
MKRIALVGGSGFIGRHIASRLVSEGWRLDICTRHAPSRLPALQVLPQVRIIPCPRLDQSTLADVLAGCDAVVSMAGILHGGKAQFAAAHAELPERIVAACKTAGIRRLIHISALGAAADSPSDYQRSKAAGEKIIRDSELDWTILRPSVVFGRDDHFLTLFARLNHRLPLIVLAGAQASFQPIWVDDVAQAVARVLARPATVRQTLDLVGPQRFTLAELVRYMGKIAGYPRPILPLPLAAGMLLADLLSCLPGPPLMSRDNLRALRRDNVSDSGFPTALLGFSPQPLQAIVRDRTWLR